MKLYIDDLRKCPSGWTLARTISEAIRILATQNVEEVSIDHDIATECCGCTKSSNETFEPVAWFLREQCKSILVGIEDIRIKPKVTLHTANPIGAKKMAEILADAGIKAEIVLGIPVNGLE